jgi:hypothetical protein
MSKSCRWALIIYMAFFAIVVLIEGHGFTHRPLTPIERILVALMWWAIAAQGVQSGSVMGRFARVERDDSPIYFWTIVSFTFLAGLFIFVWGLRDAFH